MAAAFTMLLFRARGASVCLFSKECFVANCDCCYMLSVMCVDDATGGLMFNAKPLLYYAEIRELYGVRE